MLRMTNFVGGLHTFFFLFSFYRVTKGHFFLPHVAGEDVAMISSEEEKIPATQLDEEAETEPGGSGSSMS